MSNYTSGWAISTIPIPRFAEVEIAVNNWNGIKLQVLIKLWQNSFNQEGKQDVPRATELHSLFERELAMKKSFCTPVYDKLVKAYNGHLTSSFLRKNYKWNANIHVFQITRK
jgi:hypothetical protein